jgi:dipeptidase E
MKLLLTSAGIHDSFRNDFLSILSKPLSKISVSYIITAAFGEKGNKSWINIAKEQLRTLGISDIEDFDIRGKTENELYFTLFKKDVILVNGGNTFYLLKYAKECRFDKVIVKLVNEGKLYIGISAGSYIACPTIKQAHWKHQDKNDYGMTDLRGFNLVPFLITAHFKEDFRKIVERETKLTNYPVVCLFDTQAVLVDNNLTKIIGEGKKVFYNKFKEQT